MKKGKISASIIDKIKKEKIEQHSKLYFLAKFSLFLLGGIIFFIVGVIASAVIWHFFHDTELLAIFSLGRGLFIKGLLLSFPVFWLLLTIALGFVVSFFARNTKKGYRTSYKKWFVLAIIAQILGGLALEQSPLGKHLEHDMMRKVMIGKSREAKFQELWQNPEKGLLIGEIVSMEEDAIMVLRDLDETEWLVQYDKQNVRSKGALKIEGKIRVVGKKTGETSFDAERVMGLRFDFSRPPRPKRNGRTSLQNRQRNDSPRLNRRNQLLKNTRNFHKDQLGF